jgi:hypothetical protein
MSIVYFARSVSGIFLVALVWMATLPVELTT